MPDAAVLRQHVHQVCVQGRCGELGRMVFPERRFRGRRADAASKLGRISECRLQHRRRIAVDFLGARPRRRRAGGIFLRWDRTQPGHGNSEPAASRFFAARGAGGGDAFHGLEAIHDGSSGQGPELRVAGIRLEHDRGEKREEGHRILSRRNSVRSKPRERSAFHGQLRNTDEFEQVRPGHALCRLHLRQRAGPSGLPGFRGRAARPADRGRFSVCPGA